MVNYLEQYRALIMRAAQVYTELIELYESSSLDETESARNSGEASVYRKGLLETLALPRLKITAEITSVFIVATGRYLDNHWADYTTFPIAPPHSKEYPATDAEKRQRLLRLHADLQTVIDGVGEIYNALRLIDSSAKP